MLDVLGPTYRTCDGVSRRCFLRAGFLGLAGLSLADHLRAQEAVRAAGRPTKNTAVILLWLGGGPSHLDMYDLKPEAPAEFRGEFKPIRTNVPGIDVGEHLPLQARHMDKMAVVRSGWHTNAGHGMGAHWMLTGYVPTIEINDNLHPSCGSIVAKMRGSNAPKVPPYVCLPSPPGSANAAYLGVAYNPFSPGSDPNSAGFQVRDLQLPGRVDLSRFKSRRDLLRGMDDLRKDVDILGAAEGFDRFYQDAFDIVTSRATRDAFDIGREDPRLRDRYGRDSWGQSALLARRLVEAGVTYVTVNMGGWDTHGNNFESLRKNLLPKYDRAGGAGRRPARPRPERARAGDGLRRVRPYPADQQGRRPRSLAERPVGGVRRRRAAHGAGDRLDRRPSRKPEDPAVLGRRPAVDHVPRPRHRPQARLPRRGETSLPILNEGNPIAELVG
ncbi:MAG: DUF1501 domain-containing protein [Gemmataceae bacterium]